jgi:hypothetical protein
VYQDLDFNGRTDPTGNRVIANMESHRMSILVGLVASTGNGPVEVSKKAAKSDVASVFQAGLPGCQRH